MEKLKQVSAEWMTPNALKGKVITHASPLSGGLSNPCWLLEVNGQYAVWRPDTRLLPKLGLCRLDEAQVLDSLSAKPWAPKVLLGCKEGVLLHYVSGGQYQGSLSSAMALLSEIHRQPAPKHALYPPSRAEHYWRCIEQPSVELKLLRRHFQSLAVPEPMAHVLCHFDFGLHNLINGKQGLVVIDWEFSAAGCPALDIAMTAIMSDQTLSAVIESYVQHTSWSKAELTEKVMAWLPWCQYLAVLWYRLAGEHWQSDELLNAGRALECALIHDFEIGK
ncbi:phosphotransferase [Thaumasiovibrio subtropicus]|uniref:phosphotransferase n=1 Tax=Thaumasiovibrio subtropicus TaxID=1891207 RepID=UPI000B3584E6|nr:phosphotransferase [Thaumasiovibrio subtropicus]